MADKLHRWKQGETLTAIRLDDGHAAVNRIIDRYESLDGRVAVAERRLLELPWPSAVSLHQMRVIDIHFDSLTCKEWDGIELGSENIIVAKPSELRKTGIDGVTFDLLRGTFSYSYGTYTNQKRTSTNTADSSTEAQVVIPAYEEDIFPLDIIYAAKPIGGIGATVSGRNDVEFIDVNVAGRAWAEETP